MSTPCLQPLPDNSTFYVTQVLPWYPALADHVQNHLSMLPQYHFDVYSAESISWLFHMESGKTLRHQNSLQILQQSDKQTVQLSAILSRMHPATFYLITQPGIFIQGIKACRTVFPKLQTWLFTYNPLCIISHRTIISSDNSCRIQWIQYFCIIP